MSTVYVLEPPTKGKVIITTSYGPLDIELWPKEAPKAARNFIQLCLEGYYNNTIFHRVIKSFLVQGGDPTGTGEGNAICAKKFFHIYASYIFTRVSLCIRMHYRVPKIRAMNKLQLYLRVHWWFGLTVCGFLRQ